MKMPRSKLRGPDGFVSTMDRLTNMLARNKFVVVIAILLVAGIGFGLALNNHFQEQKTKKINAEIYAAAKSDDHVQLIEELVKKYSKNPAAEFTKFKLVSDYLAKNDLDKALALTEDFQLKGFFASLMLWNKAQILWEQGKADDALKALDAYIDDEDVFQDYLVFLKAEILWSQEKIQDALALYDQLAHANEDADPTLVEMANLRYLYLKSLL